MKVNLQLKKLRIERNLTQKETAKIFNVSHATIFRWENNICRPNFSQLVSIADYFDVSIDFLIGKSMDKKIHKHISLK